MAKSNRRHRLEGGCLLPRPYRNEFHCSTSKLASHQDRLVHTLRRNPNKGPENSRVQRYTSVHNFDFGGVYMPAKKGVPSRILRSKPLQPAHPFSNATSIDYLLNSIPPQPQNFRLRDLPNGAKNNTRAVRRYCFRKRRNRERQRPRKH